MVGVFVESDEYKKCLQSRIGGAAQPNANAKVLAAVEILVPPPRVQRDFHELVEPLVDENSSTERPMSFAICRSKVGEMSRPLWNGTVVLRPSGCRNCLCDPRCPLR